MLIAAIIGFLFGFIGSMPVAGPIAVIVFARGIEGRLRSGLAVAVGGALAEGVYAFLAFWGFSKLLAHYTFILPASRAVAAIVLIGLGIIFLRKKPIETTPSPVREGWGGGFFLGFGITALNPTLIATWSAASATLFSTGLVSFDATLAIPFGLAAILGIVAWFGSLLLLVRRYRGRFSARTLTKILRVMGICVIALGIVFAALFVHNVL